MESKPAPSSPQPQETESSSVPLVTSDSSQTTARREGKYVLPWNRPSVPSSAPLDLHRRCRETIERCAAKLRERQRKMERLQIVLPSPKTQRTTRQRPNCQHLTPPSRSTPPRPTKRNKLGATPIFDRKTHSTLSTPPSWSPSPVSVLGSRHSLHTTPPSRFTSPSLNPKSAILTQTQLQSTDKTKNNSPSQLNQQEEKHETSDSHQPNAWALRQKNFMAAIEAEALSDSNSV